MRFDADRLLVCDTVAGELVAVSLPAGERRVLASGLRSPWDVLVLAGGRIAVAEAGLHRIVAVGGEGGPVEVLAGSRAEGLRDGPALQAHLAQPSGLAVLDGDAIAFADLELSALRVLRDGRVETLVGTGLFDWGTADGDRDTARLQHPLGVAALPDAIDRRGGYVQLTAPCLEGRRSQDDPLCQGPLMSLAASTCSPTAVSWSRTRTTTG